jgi:hypothetical protein
MRAKSGSSKLFRANQQSSDWRGHQLDLVACFPKKSMKFWPLLFLSRILAAGNGEFHPKNGIKWAEMICEENKENSKLNEE